MASKSRVEGSDEQGHLDWDRLLRRFYHRSHAAHGRSDSPKSTRHRHDDQIAASRDRWHHGLLASLAIVSVTFSLADLSDKSQALGLPEGLVRAVIALSLIVLFAITSVFLHSSLAARGVQRTPSLTKQEAASFATKLRADELVGTEPSPDDKTAVVVYRLGSQAAEDFAKQVFTLIGTLMNTEEIHRQRSRVPYNIKGDSYRLSEKLKAGLLR